MTYRRYSPVDDFGATYFFDDFTGALYSNSQWSTLGGSGSIVVPSPNIGGQIIVRANSGSYYQIWQQGLAFSVGRKFQVTWKAKISSLVSAAYWIGLQTDLTNRIRWYYDSTVNANWWARVATGSEADSGVVADTNWHEFKIVANTGVVNFFLDGISKAVITASIPTGNMSPYIYVNSWTTGTKDAYADWVEVYGDRVSPITS